MQGQNFDIFISYRRSDGDKVARIFDLSFKNAGYRCFLDYNSIEGGLFEQKIKVAIEDAPVFVMVMTPDYFSRCNQEGDWVRKEIELALKCEKTIVPISIDDIVKCVPDIGDEDFQSRVGAHNFAIVYTNSTFNATFCQMLDDRIRKVIDIVDNVRNKAKVRVISDVDCDLMRAGELIATLQAEEENLIYISGGKYEVKAESCDYRDIVQTIQIDISEVSHESDIKVKLAKRVKRRLKKEKRKKENFWGNLINIVISLSICVGVIILLMMWDVDDDETYKTLKEPSDDVYSVSYSPDGKYIAAGCRDEGVFSLDGEVFIWNAINGVLIHNFKLTTPATSVSWSPYGNYLAVSTNGYNGEIYIWNTYFGEINRVLVGHSDYVNCVSWSPDGKYLASGSDDKTVIIWDANSGAKLKTLEGHSDDVESVSWSPDGKYLASGSDDGTVIIWDANSGEKLKILEEHLGYITSVCWSPNGKYLASSASEDGIRIWDVEVNMKCVELIKTDTGIVNSIVWSPNSKFIIIGTSDEMIRVYDMKRNIEIGTINGHSSEINSVSIKPDGMYIVSGSEDETVKIWGPLKLS